MTTHELKTWPGPFAAVLSGEKTHEVRKNDRGYAVGDRLLLREYVVQPVRRQCGQYLGDNDATCPQLTCIRTHGHDGLCDNVNGDEYTGRSILVEVTHLTADSWGLPSGLVVMSIRKAEPDGADAALKEMTRRSRS
jgi:hypothetical protein